MSRDSNKHHVRKINCVLTPTVSLHVHMQLYSKMKYNWNCFLAIDINSFGGDSSGPVHCPLPCDATLMIMMAEIIGNAFLFNLPQ